MTRLLLLAAAAALTAGGAHAQGYEGGGYLPPPAYAGSGYDYAGGEEGGRRGFTLAGARAGVTVLGIDLDAHAGLDIGVHDQGYGGGYGRPVGYAPPPPPPPIYETGYGQGGYGQGGYAQGGYEQGGYPQSGYEQGGYGQGGYEQGGYAQGGYEQGGYAPMMYASPPMAAYGGYGRSYDVPCGCGW